LPTTKLEHKEVFTDAQIQKGLGEIATAPTKYLANKKAMETFGPNYEQLVPQARDLINQRYPETQTETGVKEPTQPEQKQVTPNLPRPKEYPNAVWNSKYGMWTVMKNGKLIGLQAE
jgi:hypothetical protein